MTIQERIKKDMVNAMKNKETDKVSFLRFLMGEFTRGYKKNIDDKYTFIKKLLQIHNK